jgi:hypothetical protein
MGTYIIRHLKEQLLGKNGISKKDIQVYANDFCANVKDALKERLLILNELYTLDPQSDKFDESCTEKFSQTPEVINPWYVPSLPSNIMTISDTCQALSDMLQEIQMKNLHRFDKAIQYALLLTLELDFNSREEKIYNECIDFVVK